MTYEAASSPRGLFWPPVDPSDDAAYKRLTDVAPYYIKSCGTVGAAIDGTDGRDMAAFPYPILIGLDTTDEDLAYNMTKAMIELLPAYSGKTPVIEGWALEFQQLRCVIPYHAGAVRYFKEAGLWTDAAQTHNDTLVARRDALATAWAK